MTASRICGCTARRRLVAASADCPGFNRTMIESQTTPRSMAESLPRINCSALSGNCDVERPSNLRTEELGRCHPDDRERDALDDERRADDVGVPAETPLPHPVADDRHRTIRSATPHIVGCRERTAEERWHAKRREEIAADIRAIDRLHLSAGG